MAIDSYQFEAEKSSYGALENGNDILAEKPGVRAGIESIAAGINPEGTLPTELLLLVEFKVASLVGCPF